MLAPASPTMARSAAPRRDPTSIPNPYRSARAQAWRNAMVAGVNAGLAAGLIGLAPGANLWPGVRVANQDPTRRGAVFRFTLPGGIPAVAWVGDAGFDELSVHVALWPTPEAERWVVCSNGGRLVGEVFASGWLERRGRPYLQSSPNLFTGARDRIAEVAALSVAPWLDAYGDRGRVQI